jgi:hypothetical protein
MKKYFPLFVSGILIVISLTVRVTYTKITDARLPISDFDRNLYQGIQIWLVAPIGTMAGFVLLFFPKQFNNWSKSIIGKPEKPVEQSESFLLRIQGLFILTITSIIFWYSLQPFLGLLNISF